MLYRLAVHLLGIVVAVISGIGMVCGVVLFCKGLWAPAMMALFILACVTPQTWLTRRLLPA